MDRARASEVAAAWVQAHGPRLQEVQGLHPWLLRALMSLVPDDAEIGTAFAEDAPVVVAADNDSLLLVTAEGANGDACRVRAMRIGLKGGIGISVDEHVGPEGRSLLRTRRWAFRPVADDAIIFSTRELLQAMFAADQGPTSGELVARRAARSAGWAVPETDQGAGEYR